MCGAVLPRLYPAMPRAVTRLCPAVVDNSEFVSHLFGKLANQAIRFLFIWEVGNSFHIYCQVGNSFHIYWHVGNSFHIFGQVARNLFHIYWQVSNLFIIFWASW